VTQYVYRFGGGVDDSSGSVGVAGNKNLLGGKGANLDGMAAIGLPVPPGFTITTEVCTAYYANGEAFPRRPERTGRKWHCAYRGLSPAKALAIPQIRCSSRCAPAHGCRCRE
jgi:hypothetical protein